MAAWPDLDELKRVLDVTSDDWDGEGDDPQTDLPGLLATAIARVKSEVGVWDEDTDEPDVSLSRAALRLAELMALKPEVAAAVAGTDRGAASFIGDPTYQSMIYGHRRAFPIG